MITLLMIRHGENDFIGKRLAGHLPGVHLNKIGHEQAVVLAQTLSEEPIKVIYSSPLERAQETANPLAKQLNLPVILNPALMEVDFGDWQGQEIETLRQHELWQVVQMKPSKMRFPGGETFFEAQKRIVAGIEKIIINHNDGETIACFSHCDSIRLAVAHYLGMPLDSFQRLVISTASVTTLELGGKAPRLVHLNITFPSHPVTSG